MAGEVVITITARDMSQQQLDALSRSLRRVEGDGAAAAAGIQGFDRGMQNVTRAVERGYGIMTRLDLTQISLQQSAQRVTQAQDRLSQAAREHGPASEQAVQANRELENAQAALEKTQLRARLSYVLVAGDLVTMAAKAPAAIAGLQGLGASALAAARGLTAVQIAGGAVLGTLGAVAAAVVGLAAWKAYTEDLERGATASEELALAQEDLARKAAKPDLFGGPILGNLEKLAGMIPGVTTHMEELDAASRRVAEAEAAMAAENAQAHFDSLADAAARAAEAVRKAEEAARHWQQTNQGLVQDTKTAVGAMGVEWDRFTTAQQAGLLRSVGVAEDFLASMQPAVNVETLLASSSGEARKALLDQLEVTNKKGQTTEETVKSLGLFKEEEEALRQEGRLTEEGIVSQEAAMQRLGRTTQDWLATWLATGVGAAPPGFQSAGGGGTSIQGGGGRDPGAAVSFGMPQAVIPVGGSTDRPNVWGGRTVVRAGRVPTGANQLDEELQSMLARRPGAIGNPAVQTYFRAVQQELGGASGEQLGGKASFGVSTLLSLRSRALPFLAAAHGFGGRIDRPTLFLAGEAGPERVDIQPTSGTGTQPGIRSDQPTGIGQGGGRSQQVIQVTNHFHYAPGEGRDPAVGRSAELGVLRAADVLERRRASMRTF